MTTTMRTKTMAMKMLLMMMTRNMKKKKNNNAKVSGHLHFPVVLPNGAMPGS